MPAPTEKKVTLVGAGPVGTLLSIFLAERGYEVEIFERRPDMRRESISAGRSINLAMSVRGLHALERVGMDREALAESVAMPGRIMHALTGQTTFQPYGREDQCIYSISRGGLNRILMTRAEKTGRVKIHFNERVVRYDVESGELELLNERTGRSHPVAAPIVIGTDGSASALREEILAVSGASCSQDYLDYGYKEIEIPSADGGGYRIERNGLHIWPRGSFMLIALPNFNGSFTCTLFLPFEGTKSFDRLSTSAEVDAFFRENFPDAIQHMPHLRQEFSGHPTGRMVTVRSGAWSCSGKRGFAGLVGDSAHAIVPFYGQGMNCGFEDCEVLGEFLSQSGKSDSWEESFREYERARKPDTEAIADMAIENFIEMRDKVGDPRFLLEKQVERVLQKEFPENFVSRYSLVSFSRAPYREALRAGVEHSRILAELSHGLKSIDGLDLALAKKRVSGLRAPR